MKTTTRLALVATVGLVLLCGPGRVAMAQVPVASPAVAAPAYVSNPPQAVGYFYNDLKPYGAWVTIEGLGWCWQPREVALSPGWRPYCNSGHWVWTDAGWCWQSDYPWGWAAFHYGRWRLHERCGWVWAPDTLWAPAWVAWRVYGDQCGWAPLPPGADCDVRFGLRFNGVSVGLSFGFGLGPEHFTFIGLRDFQERDLERRRLPAAEVAKIYSRTTIINSRVVNNAIVNRGIAVERVTAATHKPIQKVVIRDMPAGSARPSGMQGMEKGQSVVYRPKLAAPARPVSMVAQKVDQRHPVIQHASAAPQPSGRTASGPVTDKPASRPNVRNPESRPTVNQGMTAPNRSPAPRPAPPSAPASNPRTVSSHAARPAVHPTDSAKSAATAPGHPPQSAPRVNSSPPQRVGSSQGQHNYIPKTAQQARELRPAPQGSETKK
jgi:hypothetical protein